MKRRPLLAVPGIATLLALTACTTAIHQAAPESVVKYNLTATSESHSSRTGITCVDAQGQIWLDADRVMGLVTDERQRNFRIQGKLDAQQHVEAGIAINGELVAAWRGQLDPDGGAGRWRDESGCYGSWQATPVL